nr:hypothetical protein [Tanacetum cinerariifolium]
MLPIKMINDEIRNSKAYKEYYALATREAVPKPKASARRKMSGSETSITPPTATITPTTIVAITPRLTAAAKGKQPAKAKSPSDPSEVARTEAQQLNIVLKRSRQQTHISQLGSSGTDEGTGSKPGVSDVPTNESEEELSWNSSDDKGADAQEKVGDDDKGDERDKSDDKEEDDDDDKDGDERDNDDNDDEQEIAKIDEQDDTERGVDDDEETESDGEETREEESFDPIPRTPKDSVRISEEERLNEEEEAEELYRDSIFATASSPVAPLQTSTPIMTPSTIATITTISHAPIPPTTIPSEVLQNLPTFDSVFRFEDRLKSLEANFSEYIQTNSFAEAVFNIPGIVHQYMNQQMTESVNAQLEAEVLTRSSHSSRTSYVVAADPSEMELKKNLIEKMEGNKSIQRSDEQRNLYKALVDAYEADKTILDSYGETVILKRRRDNDDDQEEGPSAGSDRGSNRWREGKEPESASASLETATRSAGRSTTGSKSQQVLASESAFAEEPVQTTFHMDEPSYPMFESEKQADSCSSFNELLDTPLDFSNFIMNRLRVDTLTPELLAGPTYELMKGSCTSLIELEYHLEEVYKATTDQLDWVNPEGQQYLHNLLQPLPLIPNNRGRRVIPFAHYINNDLEYLRGGASSRKYTTSVTKTKVADYGNIKWIKDLFYGFAVNWESTLDVYSKRRIIAVTDLKIVEWHSYKHLDWIAVRRDDDKLYKFKEGNFKRMFTRSIVIQRRVEDLQLGVESYQKRLNLTKPDTYRSDLKGREAYTAYSNPRGFIYQNKDKKNRLMRIVHKFSDGTLNDVRNAFDDRLKGIRMQYLPQTIWRKGDKDRAAAMIQAIDKMLKTRRIMRSLERFIGGRLYEGDFRMLQRAIRVIVCCSFH